MFSPGQTGHVAEHNRIVTANTGRFSVHEDAAGNGTTDDTAAWQAAIDACAAAGGGVVEGFAATFSVSALTLKSGVHIDLAGGTLKGRSGTLGLIVSPGSTAISDCSVRRGTLDLNSVCYSAVYLSNASRVVVEDNTVVNMRDPQSVGVRLLTDTIACTVHNNHITAPDDPPPIGEKVIVGVLCESAGDDDAGASGNETFTFTDPTNLSEQHVITGNRITGGSHGIALTGAANCVVAGNYLDGQSHRSIILSARSVDNTISDNVCQEFISTGIHLAYGSDRNTITGNTVRTSRSDIESDGIKAYLHCRDVAITGNVVHGIDGDGNQGNVGAGIRLAGSTTGLIVGNVITECLNGVVILGRLAGEGYLQPTSPPDVDGVVITGNLINARGVTSATGVTIDDTDDVAITNVTNANNTFVA